MKTWYYKYKFRHMMEFLEILSNLGCSYQNLSLTSKIFLSAYGKSPTMLDEITKISKILLYNISNISIIESEELIDFINNYNQFSEKDKIEKIKKLYNNYKEM